MKNIYWTALMAAALIFSGCGGATSDGEQFVEEIPLIDVDDSVQDLSEFNVKLNLDENKLYGELILSPSVEVPYTVNNGANHYTLSKTIDTQANSAKFLCKRNNTGNGDLLCKNIKKFKCYIQSGSVTAEGYTRFMKCYINGNQSLDTTFNLTVGDNKVVGLYAGFRQSNSLANWPEATYDKESVYGSYLGINN